MTSPPLPPPAPLPLEVRAIGVLLVFEIAAGLWFALNWPPGMSVFLSQIPAFGAVGMVWGFLPKDPKEAFAVWLAARLRRPMVWMSTAFVFATAMCTSCFVNTVAVKGAPSDATWIHLHKGDVARAAGDSLAPSDSLRLRRGSGPRYFWVWTWPAGRTVWLRSASHLTPDERRVLPWRPTSLEYPDDFELPSVLAALPGKQALFEMASPRPMRIFVLEMLTGDTLAIDTVSTPGAILFGFMNSEVPADAATQWRGEAEQLAGGIDSLVLGAWVNGAHARFTRRPLRAEQRLRLFAVDANDSTLWMREVLLHDGVTSKLVAP
ncbi:MAG: hypothetical protein IPF98_09275 [Gemmatimonadetes bacterium]|nr:hypothetical protein [Gemmatimonadota bacterium]MCC6771918.1 hypothetical protein [Gemmatimonadaceae bacterium]